MTRLKDMFAARIWAQYPNLTQAEVEDRALECLEVLTSKDDPVSMAIQYLVERITILENAGVRP